MNTASSALTADPRDFYSTNLNHRIKSVTDLTKRIAYSLGWPQVNVETHAAQVYDSIAIACEMFTKYAGYTEEYLVFDSKLYDPAKGLRMDKLMTFTPEMSASMDIIDKESHMSVGNMITDPSSQAPFTVQSQSKANQGLVEAPVGYDALMLNYRKVIDIFAFEEGSTAGVNTLFTIEQTLAQQTYFSYAMGKYGFDLVSWYTLKEWMDTRKKLLGQTWHVRFEDRTQSLFIIPNPGGPNRARFYGLVGCYVEKRLADVIKELWVYKYSLALTKVALGRIRGKYANTALFGGGGVNGADVLAEGLAEQAALEEHLYTGAAGVGDAAPPRFFVG